MQPNRGELLIDGHEIRPSLLADIRAARKRIHISMFLWFRDPIGDEIADAVIARVREGVEARVLVNVEKTAMGDPFSTGEKEMMKHDPAIDFDATDVKPLCDRMRAAGVQVFDTNIDYDLDRPHVDPRLRSTAAQICEAIDIDDLHIDHRKIVTIDGQVGYCGGANIGAQYMYNVPFLPEKDSHEDGEERKQVGLPEPWWKWHDSLTRFEGPIVGELEQHFHDRFILDGGKPYDVAKVDHVLSDRGFPLTIAQSHSNEPNDHPNEVRELYVRLIRDAQMSIFIENPYFYHPALADALCDAKRARPELAITLVVPALKWNDIEFAHDAQQHEYARYLSLGIEVHEYQRHFNHLKIAVFDERYSIHGSTNGNFRSLEDDKDFELVVLVDDPPFAKDVLTRDRDVTRSRQFTKADLADGVGGFRIRHRDPRTMLLVSRKML